MRGIEDLKKECEKVMGKSMVSPANFNEMSLCIKKSTGRDLSVSTLKRIWGYVNNPHSPSAETLSVLSEYVGYHDWQDFRNSDKTTESSDFIGKDIIKTSTLNKGSLFQIRWKPDRQCTLEYLGAAKLKVVEARNCKLREGDEFSCGVIAKGEPLVCHEIRRQGELLADGYVAGKTDGILSLEILE